MPKADSPNPAQLSPAEVADLAERFVRCVTEYLEWDKVQRLTAATAHPTTPGSPAESDLVRRLEDTSGHKYEAAARIREDGLVLAAGLEFYGFDSSGVLSVTHCGGVGGGGPDYVRPKWEQNKVALQRAAIRLRCPDTVEQRQCENDIEEPAKPCSDSVETADDSALIRRLLLAEGPQQLTGEDLTRLRTYLETLDKSNGLQRDKIDANQRRKLQSVLDYNNERHPADSRWPTVVQVARITALNRGTISRAVDCGELRSNGKSGRARRIEPQGLIDWVLARTQRGEPCESAEYVKALLKKHVTD